MKKIYSYLLYVVVRLLAFLPLPVLFFFSDFFLYPLVYYVVRYRLKVVRNNLRNSFPEKSVKELRSIEQRFYHHFCDSFQETLHILDMSEEEAKKRMVYTNPDLLTDYAKHGQGVLIVLGHYGNWEYVNFAYLYVLKSGNQQAYSIYRPLKNEAFDYLYFKIRTHFKVGLLTKNETYRTLIRLRRDGIAAVYGLICDQTPSGANLHYWTTFLNQDTAILVGPERMAKQTGFAVLYADVQKTSRGHYQTTFKRISDTPGETAEFEITEEYARLMEKTIQRDPAYWLWTHKRWKHKRLSGVKQEIEKK
ncbi:MAG: lysophospholipid acyltransferase family protein [Bacteroidales bacterium]|nr:lysophospholipid acyltransferase family protein [Bacteroidales bacterium]